MKNKIFCIIAILVLLFTVFPAMHVIAGTEKDQDLKSSPFITCFAEGTKITLADRSEKNIEDLKIGDKVLSYDPETNKYGEWTIINVEHPNRPVTSINNGLLLVTEDHPLWIKKSTEEVGWGQLEVMPNHVRLRGEKIYKIEVGDMLYTDKGLVKIESIIYNEEVVKVANIFSITGKNTYFANGVLAYEEFPYPKFMLRYYLYNIFAKIPALNEFKDIFLF